MERSIKDLYIELAAVNLKDKTGEKGTLTYLSWSDAIDEVSKRVDDFDYDVEKFTSDKGTLLPYMYDPNTGYMVFTWVKINGVKKMMMLPVMDGANNTMLDHPYSYETKYGKKISVAPATMFDINKTIMRCLVKNIAMFGLGLYIYKGEDLPEDNEVIEQPKATAEQVKKIKSIYSEADLKKMLAYYKVTKLEDISVQDASFAIKVREEKNAKQSSEATSK